MVSRRLYRKRSASPTEPLMVFVEVSPGRCARIDSLGVELRSFGRLAEFVEEGVLEFAGWEDFVIAEDPFA